MQKYNPDSTCRFPTPKAQKENGGLTILHFVHEPKPFSMDEFISPIFYTFYLVINGSCTFSTDYEDFEIKKGDCFFCFPQKRYKIHNTVGLKVIYISFINTEATQLLKSLGVTYTNPVKSGLKDHVGFFVKEFKRSSDSNSGLLAKSLLYYALSHFEVKAEEQTTTNKSDPIQSIINYINEHYKEKLTLQELSQEYFFSYNYISQLFIKTTGMTFSNYLTIIRMSHAKNLLTTTKKSINEISNLTGFSSPHYFELVFKKYSQFTPTEYRKKFFNKEP